ncbi:MAG: hypothetical protein R2731_00390 [Nocardioides sp.]
MSLTKDPIFDALDRLAGVADTDPVGDRMPAITRRARVHRQRAAALTAAGAAAALAVGYAAITSLGPAGRASDPGYATSSPSPTTAPTSDPSAPTLPPPESARPSDDVGTPEGSNGPADNYRAVESVRADVDGDGSAERLQVMLPKAEAAAYDPRESVTSDHISLVVWQNQGADFVAGMSGSVPTFAGTPDLDGDGAAEVVLAFSGGDGFSMQVWTASGPGTGLAPAEPDLGGAPSVLAEGSSLFGSEATATGVALADGRLVSWRRPDQASPQVDTWVWQLDGAALVPVSDGTKCFTPGDAAPTAC